MIAKTKLALDALLDLPPHERGLVFCWFCDACYEHVGPGETHRCAQGSEVYPSTLGAPKTKPTRAEVQEAMMFYVSSSPRNIIELAHLQPDVDVEEALILYRKQADWARDVLRRARSEGVEE